MSTALCLSPCLIFILFSKMSIINLSFGLSFSFISFFPLFFSSVINLSVFFSVFHFFCPFFNLLPKSPSIYPAGSKIHFAAFFFFFVAIRSFFLLSNILCIIFHPSLGHSIKKIFFLFLGNIKLCGNLNLVVFILQGYKML
jgi:hypothetical protein